MTVTAPQWERQRQAMATLEWRQRLSANWQLALSDGITDMTARLDFQLRERLRDVLEAHDERIGESNPTHDWARFDSEVRGQLEEVVRETFAYARHNARQLSEHVATALTGQRDGAPAGARLPRIDVPDPDQALRLIKPMVPPKSGDGVARVVNSVRGSYGGILMVGVLTSLAGLQLISVYSVLAGLALGAFTWWEDRKNGLERGRVEARLSLAKAVDQVNFRVGEELRTQLRTVHRTLRDHYTDINDRNLRTAAEAVNAAMAG